MLVNLGNKQGVLTSSGPQDPLEYSWSSELAVWYSDDELADSLCLERKSYLICSDAEELSVSDWRIVFKGNVATPTTAGLKVINRSIRHNTFNTRTVQPLKQCVSKLYIKYTLTSYCSADEFAIFHENENMCSKSVRKKYIDCNVDNPGY